MLWTIKLTSSDGLIWVGSVLLWAAVSAWDCTMPRWEYPWLGWDNGSTNFYMNSINAGMLSVSCINLKQTVVKIGPLGGRALFIDSVYRSPHSLILQLFPRWKTNASFITAAIETNILFHWLMYIHHTVNVKLIGVHHLSCEHCHLFGVVNCLWKDCSLKWSQLSSMFLIHFYWILEKTVAENKKNVWECENTLLGIIWKSIA